MSAYSALLLWFAAAAFGIVGLRGLQRLLAARLAGWIPAPRVAVIVGNGPQASVLLKHLATPGDPALHIAGFFEDEALTPGPLHGTLRYLGDLTRLPGFLAERGVEEVFIAMPWSGTDRIATVLDALRFMPVTVRLLPENLPLSRPSRLPGASGGMTLPTLMVPPFSLGARCAKRLFDVSAAAVLLAALAPVLLAIAVAIKLDSPGQVLFRQARIGQFGRRFAILKFRTLHAARADAAAETLVTRGDTRVTRVGRVLRRYSLDELPQIINVLTGDMSLVGPRPHADRAKAAGQVYAAVLPDYLLRYRAKPGMTGWAQVHGWRGNTDTLEKLSRRVEFDFEYIQCWSFALDLYILARTLPTMLAPGADNT